MTDLISSWQDNPKAVWSVITFLLNIDLSYGVKILIQSRANKNKTWFFKL